jgi:hypothetical protein
MPDYIPVPDAELNDVGRGLSVVGKRMADVIRIENTSDILHRTSHI